MNHFLKATILLCVTLSIFACNEKNGAFADLDTDLHFSYTKVTDVFVKSVGAPELTTQQKNDVITKSYRFLASLNSKVKQANPAALSKTISHYTIAPVTLKISDSESVSLCVAHLTNNETNDGYMIFVNDNRIPYPLAYSDSGSWDISENEELQAFILERFRAHITDEIKNAEVAAERPQTKGGSDECPWTITSSTSGILASGYCLSGVTWGQSKSPYDLFTPPRTSAGCVAVAVAHIMAYHQHPAVGIDVLTFILPHSYYWSWMKSQPKASDLGYISNDLIARNDVANLTAEIGWHASLDYSSGTGTGTTADAAQAFSDMGYTSTLYYSYGFTTIANSINANKPVFVVGGNGTSNIGHAWSIEGYESHFQRNYYEQLQENCPYVISQQFGYEEWLYWDFVWCNWGWEGEGNGNYYSGIFTLTAGGTSHNYSYDISMLTNITPI